MVLVPHADGTGRIGQVQPNGTVQTPNNEVYERYHDGYLPVDADTTLEAAAPGDSAAQGLTKLQSHATRLLNHDYAAAKGGLNKILAGHGPNSRAGPIHWHVGIWTRRAETMRDLAAQLQKAGDAPKAHDLTVRSTEITQALAPLQNPAIQAQCYVDEVLKRADTPVASQWLKLIEMGRAKALRPIFRPESAGKTLIKIKLAMVPPDPATTADRCPEFQMHYAADLRSAEPFSVEKVRDAHLKNAKQAGLTGDDIYYFSLQKPSTEKFWAAAVATTS